MPEKPSQEKTEQPTPERLRKAREKGSIPQSREVASALVLVAMLVVLALIAGDLYEFFVSQAREGLALNAGRAADVGGYSRLLKAKIMRSLIAILPFLSVGAGVSVFSGLIVAGWSCSPKAVSLKFNKLNPVTGLRNLVSLKSLVTLLTALAKLGVMVAIIWTYLDGKLGECLALRWATPAGTLGGIAKLAFGLLVRVAVGILGIALIDWAYQKWNYKKQLRMTKQEVKQEQKDKELTPQIKGRIRGIRIEMVRKRMLQEVPLADVVLTNPTHVAIALRYDASNMEAPTVVAKGPDLLGEKIKEIARAHNVPIVQRPELARTIYHTVDVGECIPETLFVALAEVLAMIYRARNKRLSGAGRTD